jgi:hypothetical protein
MPQVVKRQYVSRNSEWVELPSGAGAAVMDPLYVNISGDTMTGPLILAGNAATPLEAVPKQQLDLYTPIPHASISGNISGAIAQSAAPPFLDLTKTMGEGLELSGKDVVLSRPGWYAVHCILILHGVGVASGTRAFGNIHRNGVDWARTSYGAAEDHVTVTALVYSAGTDRVGFTMYQNIGPDGFCHASSSYSIHHLGA